MTSISTTGGVNLGAAIQLSPGSDMRSLTENMKLLGNLALEHQLSKNLGSLQDQLNAMSRLSPATQPLDENVARVTDQQAPPANEVALKAHYTPVYPAPAPVDPSKAGIFVYKNKSPT